ncbi:hypothetical protein HanXRQr2_Chr09g0383391 [Helianthus annuus]|uniref:Uncharacterized protein n=1 Tax=Helianthus annuus TaxID=4232 RepID=A0A9K3I5T8_HELAN|nr:hypothetical protein HanXRQr2_Chr09g0383391 [Helianthus annuus]KAJ0892731.1 hypothetical protein HanPSC8_Chr09g0369451 [Helianthus annuus]
MSLPSPRTHLNCSSRLYPSFSTSLATLTICFHTPDTTNFLGIKFQTLELW